jgi:hypothetical protein
MAEGSDLILKSKDYILTESVIDPKMEADQLVTILRYRKTTGTVTITFNQGGISFITVSERKIVESKSV